MSVADRSELTSVESSTTVSDRGHADDDPGEAGDERVGLDNASDPATTGLNDGVVAAPIQPPGSGPAALPAAALPAARGRRPRWLRPGVPAIVLAISLLATIALSTVAFVVNQHTEERLLRLKVKETGAVLQVALPGIQTPLASAAEISLTDAQPAAQFQAYMKSYIGSASGQFVSASLWQVSGAQVRLVTVVGAQPKVSADSAALDAFMLKTVRRGGVSVLGLLTTPHRRIGYAYTPTSNPGSYVIYGERALSDDVNVKLQPGSAFSDLKFRLYLGKSQDRSDLLITNTTELSGPRSTIVVPFGDQVLTLVAAPDGTLSGTLSAALWWIVLLAGLALSIAATLVSSRLVRGRRTAESLTREIRGLLYEQSAIAESLQRALLPQRLPAITGVELAARYLPGAQGVDVGGDWFDVIPLGDRRWFFAVGDVSGRGLEAAAVMASMHFAIRAFVSEGHTPREVLQGLAELLDVMKDAHFATVLCGVVDLHAHILTVASAGHPPALVVADGVAELVSAPVGPPIGVRTRHRYLDETFSLPGVGTLLVYTDGLVERRTEAIDIGLGRLRERVVGASGSLDDVLSFVLDEVRGESADDDTAVLGARWQ